MPAYIDKCPMCGREFTNYTDARAARTFCSVGCQFRASVPLREGALAPGEGQGPGADPNPVGGKL